MKKCLALILAFCLALSGLALAEPAPGASREPQPSPTPKPVQTSHVVSDAPEPKCKAALLMDAGTGEVLYSYNGDEHNYPASITKVMTALLTLEAVERGELGLEDKIVASDTFGYDLEVYGSTQNIQTGEELSVLELLYCALVSSANEACNILAEAVAGDVPTFVEKMNERAKELGMENTHFANAHGLHNANHYTSAHDIGLMVREALKNDTFATIVSSRSHEVPPTNLSDRRRLSSTNALINPLYEGRYIYPRAIGVKTGSTNAAGQCLASAAVSGGETLICVVLGAENVTDDEGVLTRNAFAESKRLLQWGFENFSRKTLIDAKVPVKEIPVELSADTTAVALKPQQTLEAFLPNDLKPEDFQRDITLYAESVEAPVEVGQELGELTIRNGDTAYGTVKLVAAASAQRSTLLWRLKQAGDFFGNFWVRLALVALAVLILFCIIRFGVLKPRRRGGYRGKKRR